MALTKEDLQAIRTLIQEENAPINARLDRLEQGQAEIKAQIKESQGAIVEVVDVVGQKVDTLEKSIRDVQSVAAQNAYDVQALRHKAM